MFLSAKSLLDDDLFSTQVNDAMADGAFEERSLSFSSLCVPLRGIVNSDRKLQKWFSGLS